MSSTLITFGLLLLCVQGCVKCQVVSLSKDAYVTSKVAQRQEQQTEISFQFKTIESTGVLVYIYGSGSDHYLMFELVRGKLRYASFFGDDQLNNREPAPGYREMYIERDLADNAWHHVEYKRQVSEIYISVDKQSHSRARRMGYLKIPTGAGTDFYYEQINVGGIRSYVGVDEQRSVSQQNLGTCMMDVSLNSQSLLNGVRHGTILNHCPGIEYQPISFPYAFSHLQMQSQPRQNIKLSLKFRTVVNHQTLWNHTSNTGDRLDLFVTRNGKVTLKLDLGNEPQEVSSWKRDFNDGQWHAVEFSVQTEAPPYSVSLSVDNNLRRSEMKNSMLVNGTLNFGLGFTGCMREVRLDDQPLNMRNLRRSGSVMFDECYMRDFCSPNPCHNGGKCNQTDATFFCGCRRTDFFGSACDRPRTNYTCGDIFNRGDRRSDNYHLDMDGIGPMSTMLVRCAMKATAEESITQINHTLPKDGFNLHGTDGYSSTAVPYKANEENIRELIMHSTSCRQLMKYSCKRSRIFFSPLSVGPSKIQPNRQARWFGEDNMPHYYFPGAKGKRNYCACGMDNSCIDPSRYCNCDARQETPASDGGYFTIKEHLPVRRVEFFDVNKEAGSTGHLRLGYLECKGFGGNKLAMTFREPFSFLELPPMDDNWLVDAGQLGIEFKTASPSGVLMYSRGPVTRDYIQMEIVSPTRMRLSINIGADMEYRDVILEVDVSPLNMTLNDNNWHNASVHFNRKDITFGIHHLKSVMSFWYRDGVSILNVDNSPVYVGANPGELWKGFVGCVRNVYVMGRLHDLENWSAYDEGTGVYPGCGSACVLVDNPCNHGYCVDEYTHYKCNCSVSPMEGEHCHTEPYSHSFATGNTIRYNIEDGTQLDPSDIIVSFGFKTTVAENAFFHLVGSNGRFLAAAMVNGSIAVFLNMRPVVAPGSLDTVSLKPPQASIAFNDDKRHVLRVSLSGGTLTAEIPDLPAVQPVHKKLASTVFVGLKQITVGNLGSVLSSLPSNTPNGFAGCSSGMKILLNPNENGTQTFINLYEKLINESKSFAESSASRSKCGDDLFQAEKLPTLKPPKWYASYTTARPSFGNSIPYTNEAAFIVAAVGVGTICLIFLLLLLAMFLYKKHTSYKRITEEIALSGKDTPPQRPPAVQFISGQSQPPGLDQSAPPPQARQQDARRPDRDAFFL